MLKTRRIWVDFLKPEYFASYLEHFSPRVQEQVRVSSVDQELAYLKHQYGSQTRGYTHFYCLIDSVIEEVVGALEIRNPLQFPGQLYCWFHESYWGRGYLSEVMPCISQDYFERTDYDSFNARVDEGNKRSYYGLKKCGFFDEGIINGPWGVQYALRYLKT